MIHVHPRDHAGTSPVRPVHGRFVKAAQKKRLALKNKTGKSHNETE
jgi:hypothetical protein